MKESLFLWDESTPLRTALGNALGAASVCWKDLSAGEFDSELAERVLNELHEFVLTKIDGTGR